MDVSTTNEIPTKQVQTYLGLVKGSTVQTKNFARDIGAGLKTLVGGEIKAYTQMMNDARQIAIGRMVDEATSLGANAIIGFRMESSTVMAGASELIAYGTAVIVK
jgi:uncharacterized protein YbjQ (UPF0145 family)